MENAFRSVEPSIHAAVNPLRRSQDSRHRSIADMRLVKILIRKGWLTQNDATQALAERSNSGRTLEGVLVQDRYLTLERLNEALSNLQGKRSEVAQLSYHWY